MFQRKRSVILLTGNRFDEDILRIVQPFNVVLTAIASSKFRIKNGHITPCRKTFHLLICFSIIALKLWTSFLFVVGRGDFKHKKIVDNFFCMTVFFYCVNYTLLTYNNIMHSCHNISLIMKIQNINRNIDISNSVQSYIVWTWISFLITLILFVSDISWFLLKSGIKGTVHASENVLVFQFDVNFVYGIRLMTLLVMYLKEWARNIIVMNEERPNEYFVRKLETYLNILEAFKLFTICFKAMILCRTLDSFLRGLCILEISLLLSEEDSYSLTTIYITIYVILWIMKNLAVIVITSVQCEKFYMAVEEAESACIQRSMKPGCSKKIKRLCKQVIRVNRTFTKMSACRLFTIDATLPIPLSALMANYIIVLIQFAFL